MRSTILLGIAFIVNIVLSNVCFAATTFSAPTENIVKQQLVSHEIPKSFNVVTCTWVRTEDGWQPTPDSPCASGHCLKKEKPENRCLFLTHVPDAPAALPPTFVSEENIATYAQFFPTPIIDRPPPYPGLRTTVLRT